MVSSRPIFHQRTDIIGFDNTICSTPPPYHSINLQNERRLLAAGEGVNSGFKVETYDWMVTSSGEERVKKRYWLNIGDGWTAPTLAQTRHGEDSLPTPPATFTILVSLSPLLSPPSLRRFSMPRWLR
ncbi:hypothetical protein PM082_007019 [Marasmius tenuissimus]|nr:hypothetical protein PM082_007019 [Marasmius tenuissimus]